MMTTKEHKSLKEKVTRAKQLGENIHCNMYFEEDIKQASNELKKRMCVCHMTLKISNKICGFCEDFNEIFGFDDSEVKEE